MQGVSTRPATLGPVGAHLSEIIRKAVSYGCKGSGETGFYEIWVRDDLKYAVEALNGGQAQVDKCIMLACNRIAGILRNSFGHKFDEDLQTPFPEVSHAS